MNNRLIYAEWISYRQEVMPAEAPLVQIQECRQAFYAGAWALLKTVMNILDPGTEPTEKDLAAMTSLQKELRQFADEVKAGTVSEPEKLPDDILWHQSGVNQKGEPFVQLLKGTKIMAQMEPEQARDHARAITEAAEASEQDAFIFDWVVNKVGNGPQQAAGLLADFRAYRLERTGKRGGPSDPKDWVKP